MRGATSLLYSIPRRGRLTNEVPTLSNRSTSCIGSGGHEIRSEPISLSLRSDLSKTRPENSCHASANPLTPPLLLLEGDEFFLSSSGIARTYYEIAINDKNANLKLTSQEFGLEEHYDLKGARKTFTLRQSVPGVVTNVGTQARRSVGNKLMGPSIARLDLREIDHGVVGTAGTGAATWEASIAMSLFWTLHADLLLGSVIELGSGVGLGGILSSLVGSTFIDSRMTSLTLTDHNDEVLDQCRENVLNAQRSAGHFHLNTPCNIVHLDWYDFLNDSENCAVHRNQYDTVIASDCAYRYHDLVALARTMKGLLKPNSSSRIHFFGPNNRGALLDLVCLLENERLDLAMEDIEMKRYRLKPQHGQNMPLHVQSTQNVDMAAIASQTASKYLHVAAAHKVADPANRPASIAEID